MSTGPARAAPPDPMADLAPAAAAGLAVALAATALSGVLAGPRWWPFSIVTIAVVVTVGLLLRSLRLPAPVVVGGQLSALVGLVFAVFTRSGVLVVLPGPAALGELRGLLDRAAAQIRVGVPPVPESTELLCLVVISLGLVALAVDTVSATLAAPAASGLLLLAVVAVPAALSDRLLPWWSFVLGALGFAVLLTVDGRRRDAGWGTPAGPAGSAGGTRIAVGVVAGATAAALLVGAGLTAVGTEGRLVGARGDADQLITGIGLNPFTSLRGQLDTGRTVELFRVHGLTQRVYLRALTLSRFADQQGWRQGPLDGMVSATGGVLTGGPGGRTLPLPQGVTDPAPGPRFQVQIEPVDYVDNWLPAFGYPLALDGLSPEWRYDPNAGTVFSDRRQRAEPYTELGVLPQPDAARLRAAGPAGGPAFGGVDPRYLDDGGVDPKIATLAAQVTASAPTAFDAAVALNRWFTSPQNGFHYDLRTAPGSSGDALVDFLVTGKRGYCEQFASAMAIMLRSLGVPARVAVGFTAGTGDAGTRVITTADAHAWVEAWFPGAGWIPFDPTPLTDGRAVLPRYLERIPIPATDDTAPRVQPSSAPATPSPRLPTAAAPGGVPADGGMATGTRIGLATAGVLVLALLGGLAPLAIRESRRARRMRLVAAGGAGAASAAWEEVLAESADRGLSVPPGQTVRSTARWLAREHGLDEPGREGLRALIRAVERSWYGKDATTGDIGATVTTGEATAEEALDAVRQSMRRCAPTSLRARLLPRSVLHR